MSSHQSTTTTLVSLAGTFCLVRGADPSDVGAVAPFVAMEAGTEQPLEGIIADRECVKLGHAMDNKKTLMNLNPEKHTIYCLIADKCIKSGYCLMQQWENAAENNRKEWRCVVNFDKAHTDTLVDFFTPLKMDDLQAAPPVTLNGKWAEGSKYTFALEDIAEKKFDELTLQPKDDETSQLCTPDCQKWYTPDTGLCGCDPDTKKPNVDCNSAFKIPALVPEAMKEVLEKGGCADSIMKFVPGGAGGTSAAHPIFFQLGLCFALLCYFVA